MASDFRMTSIKAFFRFNCNHAFAYRKYSLLMTYGTRLQAAMAESKVDRKTLAKHLRMSVQAVGQVLAGKTKALDAAHHTKAVLYLKCDPLWLATGVRQAIDAASVVDARERNPASAYDGLPSGLTTAERDLVKSFRQLPPRRQRELRDAVMNEATQFVADVDAVNLKRATGTAVDAARAEATLPVRPDGPQPDTVPGFLV